MASDTRKDALDMLSLSLSFAARSLCGSARSTHERAFERRERQVWAGLTPLAASANFYPAIGAAKVLASLGVIFGGDGLLAKAASAALVLVCVGGAITHKLLLEPREHTASHGRFWCVCVCVCARACVCVSLSLRDHHTAAWGGKRS